MDSQGALHTTITTLNQAFYKTFKYETPNPMAIMGGNVWQDQEHNAYKQAVAEYKQQLQLQQQQSSNTSIITAAALDKWTIMGQKYGVR